ncbi:hypothetical protein TNCV_74331 [Trichonephila clavipes]|nr:hypothetical protein TNCV_74331 [Trichonephila clavipes]
MWQTNFHEPFYKSAYHYNLLCICTFQCIRMCSQVIQRPPVLTSLNRSHIPRKKVEIEHIHIPRFRRTRTQSISAGENGYYSVSQTVGCAPLEA